MNLTKDQKYIDEMLKLAEDVKPVAAARIAACLVKKNSIIAYGFNTLKSHPLQKKFGRNNDSIFLHAETSVIKNALMHFHDPDILNGSVMYVARVKHPNYRDKSFIPGLACPCEGCQRAILEFGIKNVAYTLNDSGFDYLF